MDVETGFWTPCSSDGGKGDDLALSMKQLVALEGNLVGEIERLLDDGVDANALVATLTEDPTRPVQTLQGPVKQCALYNLVDAQTVFQHLFEQGVYDFHEMNIPGLSDQLLLLEHRNPANDVFISPAQPLSKDCLWYIQSSVPCRITCFPPTGTDAGNALYKDARMWVPQGFVQVSVDCARVGDVVIYSSDTGWYGLAGANHIGRLVSREPDMVVSKFTHGHIYMHPTGLVPHAYLPPVAPGNK